MSNATLFESNLKSLKFLHRGKVRDIYAVGDDKLLVIQSDRLSAFDVILPDPIPGKGEVLTAMSNYWFKRLGHVIPNHLTGIAPDTVVAADERAQVAGRAMVVRKFTPLMIEAVVRGYIIGSGWKDYQKTGMVCGIKLPAGLKEAQKLPEVIFTPATKAPAGQHDENISYEEAAKIVGTDLAAQVKKISIQLYSEAADYARSKGIIAFMSWITWTTLAPGRCSVGSTPNSRVRDSRCHAICSTRSRRGSDARIGSYMPPSSGSIAWSATRRAMSSSSAWSCCSSHSMSGPEMWSSTGRSSCRASCLTSGR